MKKSINYQKSLLGDKDRKLGTIKAQIEQLHLQYGDKVFKSDNVLWAMFNYEYRGLNAILGDKFSPFLQWLQKNSIAYNSISRERRKFNERQ